MLLERVAESKFITVMDATKSFWQIPINEPDRFKTAFVALGHLYEMCASPFGLSNSSRTFCRIMQRILSPHADYASAYVDDVSVYSDV